MPMYEYKCRSCGWEEEHQHSVDQRDTRHDCPDCGAVLQKSVGNKGGFRLGKDGSVGWAEDGYSTHYGDQENFKKGRKIY